MKNKTAEIDKIHIPVLASEITDHFIYLKNLNNFVFVDGTLGMAGHSLLLAKFAREQVSDFRFIGIDKDKNALEVAKTRVEREHINKHFSFVHDDFSNICDITKDLCVDTISGALLDLGVSSLQLDQKERGFSFSDPEQKLDMRMNQDQELSAEEVVNNYPEARLEKIIKEYGEENFAKRISQNIVAERKQKQIKKVGDLLSIISRSIPITVQRKSRIHFATRTFQAIRIEVNSELSSLADTIKNFVDLLDKGGKLAIISFHSLEDRIVKDTFRELENPCKCPPKIPCICSKRPTAKVLSKKPIIAGNEEISVNPRSRSAKLRVIEKL